MFRSFWVLFWWTAVLVLTPSACYAGRGLCRPFGVGGGIMKLGGAVQGIVMSCDVITRWWTTLATRAVKLPVGCDLCGQASQVYIYLGAIHK